MTRLDTAAGSVTPKQIAAMHRAPRVHTAPDELRHECCQTAAGTLFGIDSLKLLSMAQASRVLEFLGARPLKPFRSSRPAPRAQAGTIRIATEDHHCQIRRLCERLGWGDQDLHWHLKNKHRIEAVRTARDAGRVIHALRTKLRRMTGEPDPREAMPRNLA